MPCLAISAFNHPLNLIAHQLGPALALGIPTVIKPALETPLSALVLEKMLIEGGIPADLFSVVLCDNETAERLAGDPDVEFISFIGSAKVGWRLRSIAAPGTRICLEHGGTAPLVIAQSGDIEALLPKLIRGAFYHSGQVCVSTQNVYVLKSQSDRLLSILKDAVAGLRLGDPRRPDTDCGPLIRQRDVERLERWVGQAVKQGARLVIGGKRVGTQSFQPTVLQNPDQGSDIYREEVFGPILNIVEVSSIEAAFDQIRRLPWRFQAAIWTKDINESLAAARKIPAKHLLVNDSTAFRIDSMPFGGLGPSGLGTGGIYHSMLEMTDECLVSFSSSDWSM